MTSFCTEVLSVFLDVFTLNPTSLQCLFVKNWIIFLWLLIQEFVGRARKYFHSINRRCWGENKSLRANAYSGLFPCEVIRVAIRTKIWNQLWTLDNKYLLKLFFYAENKTFHAHQMPPNRFSPDNWHWRYQQVWINTKLIVECDMHVSSFIASFDSRIYRLRCRPTGKLILISTFFHHDHNSR